MPHRKPWFKCFEYAGSAVRLSLRRAGINAWQLPRVRAPRQSIVLCLSLLLSACATTPFERPEPFDDRALRERAETVVEGGVRVSATVPNAEESEAIFGIDLGQESIEPIWLEIENSTERRLLFLPTGMDSEYFAPLEVSFAFHKQFSGASRKVLDRHIKSLNFRDPINPDSTVSGFVFTNPEVGAKFLNVDLIGRQWAKNFTLIVPIPGSETRDDRYQRIATLRTRLDLVPVEDESHLRELLEQLPCCTSSHEGAPDVPLNLVVIGEPEAFAPAFGRRDYRYDPISPRYVFGRPQDVHGIKQALWVPAQPHVLRLWLAPFSFQGTHVWIGQVSSPLGGRFAEDTHDGADPPMAPDVDGARNDLIQDLIYSQSLARLGLVAGVGRAMASNPRTTPGGATYHTDGLRAVLAFEGGYVSLSELEFFDWEQLPDRYKEQPNTTPVQ